MRYVDGKPLMLEDSYMPVKLFRNLSLSHLEGSKFDYIEKECGIIISGNYETLTPVLADKQLARSNERPGADAAAAYYLPFLQRQRRVS
ncbi:HTH-type transcriptional regulator YidP [Klebsiella pneumoniae subsp. ozaenae]|uniref:HTH-type transcriptional regulator YidP n=1 Tax=Klebsiella pneumoniae subsp. ozaenae TaxID=574 RepID=A0A378AU10_KLEPO|nr:HTH-type transcriptional regulator YidP [Klebsiella pneumoniae subsp. ozaenae]